MEEDRKNNPGTEFEERSVAHVGVGPHPEPWPDDPRLDRALLAQGDRRNVIDRYRYWTVEAITRDLDERRFEFHVAIENWKHDLNIGTVVRNANAFMAARVHIVGAHRWNRRGAMCTDRYVHIEHHASVSELAASLRAKSVEVVGVDLLPGSMLIERIFQIDGFGLLMIQSISDRDFPLVMGIITLDVILIVLGNILSDFFVAVTDPRVRFE